MSFSSTTSWALYWFPGAVDKFFRILMETSGQEDIFVGLSGGYSLLPFYECAVSYFDTLDATVRNRIQFAFLDERMVPSDHPESNEWLLREVFFAPLLSKKLISNDQIIAVRTDLPNPAMDYTLRVPRIDIGLFGVGPDGHIASLFPNHPGLRNANRGFIAIADSPKPPPDRISISVRSVREIPFAFVFFISESKRQAYERFFDPDISESDCPAKYLLNCADYIVVTDLKK